MRRYLRRKKRGWDAPSALIKEMCAKWVEVKNFVEIYHPDKAVTRRVSNLVNDSAISHFRNIIETEVKASFNRKVFGEK